MNQIIKVGDQNELVKSETYPKYAKFPFEFFNPVQSRIFEFFNKDCNAVVASMTSSGKTVSSEMLAACQIREKGGKILYLAPMKALAKEKYDDWTKSDHHFADLKISICTGDYRLTEARQKELKEADIIILTSEMLNSRCRNMASEKNDFLLDARICIVDEAHLLTVPGRGDHLEVGLMNLSKLNKDMRFILLSATMPNVDEIAEWVSESLSDKETYLILSKFRPCPLGVHYESYYDVGKYDDQELEKIQKTLEIIEDHPDDKFLLFVHTKKTGELLKTELKKNGMNALFHSADLTKEQREKLEVSFKDKGPNGLQYLIATSTIAWGCHAEDSLVKMSNGSLKKIQYIDIGDEVISKADDQTFHTKHVLNIEKANFDNCYKITLDNNNNIFVSLNHEFYASIKDHSIKPDWITASLLSKGDFIFSLGLDIDDNYCMKFNSVKKIEKIECKNKSFYNIEVEDFNNYICDGVISRNCNLPARRVIILGMHRGMSEVETYDIWQMAGRAGRPGFDPRGDVYILLPESKADKHRARLQNPQNIDSKLLDNIGGHYKTLAFHIVSEIHHGRIKTKQDVKDWYSKTLANFQSKGLNDTIVNSTMELLIKCGAIKEEDGIYKVTSVGMVSSMFYYSPFDVADLRKNFMALFKSDHENEDLWISMALGNVDSIKMGIVSRSEREDMASYQSQVNRVFGKDTFLETAVKGGFAYYSAMNGNNSGSVATTMRMLQWDFPRLMQVINAIDSFGCKWGKSSYFKELQSRVLYGVKSELVNFVKLPDIGKARAERLWSLGFRDLQDIVNKSDVVKNALNFKQEKVDEIIKEAKKLILLD